MADALSGQRQAINEDPRRHSILWADRGQGAPVAVGEIFKLRSCAIQISEIKRIQNRDGFQWLALFTRTYPERSYLISRGAGDDGRGYSKDSSNALLAQDDPQAATLDSISGEPPEPEAVPPHEVATLPSSLAAQGRFDDLRERERAERRARELARRIRHLQRRCEQTGVLFDLEIAELEQILDRAERRIAA